MISLKNKSKGFTIVELLIVIVIIAILATLVIVTFTGIQKKARDSQRQTDINAVDSHLEAFYAQWGFYPAVADMKNSAFLSAYMKGLDPDALLAPNSTTAIDANASTTTKYQYNPSGTSCTTTAMATTGDPVDTGCTSFSLSAKLEGGSDFTKSSNT